MSFQVRAWIAYLIESKWDNRELSINTDEELAKFVEIEELVMMKILKLNNTTSIGDFLSEWIKACNLEQVKKGELFGFVKDGMKLLIANLDGKISCH